MVRRTRTCVRSRNETGTKIFGPSLVPVGPGLDLVPKCFERLFCKVFQSKIFSKPRFCFLLLVKDVFLQQNCQNSNKRPKKSKKKIGPEFGPGTWTGTKKIWSRSRWSRSRNHGPVSVLVRSQS